MKDLNVLIKRSLLCSILVAPVVSGAETSLESYLSDIKQQQFTYEREKVDNESDKLTKSVFEPIQLRYSIMKSNPSDVEQTTQSASVTIDQPIFRSGGIYFAIKYAEAARRYGSDTVALQERKLIKEAVALLMQIKQTELTLSKQKLLIANAAINVEQKTEQYRSGQIDSTFLDQAIIEHNTLTQASYDIQTSLQRLVTSFKTISDADYKTLKVPTLSLVSEDAFMQNNLELRQANSLKEQNRYFKNTTTAKYLPQVNFSAGYYWDRQESPVFGGGSFVLPDYEQDYYSYGLKASMPINFSAFDDMEVAKVEYLKSSVAIEDKVREQSALFEQVMQNVENFDNKIALAESNRALYEKLLNETRSLFKAGYKTEYDVNTLKNSAEIQRLEVAILQMEKQLELLNLYEKMSNDL